MSSTIALVSQLVDAITRAPVIVAGLTHVLGVDEQLLDALAQATGASVEFAGYDRGTRASELMGVRSIHERRGKGTDGDRFLKTFGKPPRLTPCDCERTNDTCRL